MRLWSLHPKHLDGKGLVALWREGLLALAVVTGKTRGYRHHPQLVRFAKCRNPSAVLQRYLVGVYDEAQRRGYHFDRSKLGTPRTRARLGVTRGQIAYEWQHLLGKLRRRDRRRWLATLDQAPSAHPIFKIVAGPVQAWEKTRQPMRAAGRRAPSPRGRR